MDIKLFALMKWAMQTASVAAYAKTSVLKKRFFTSIATA
jgi:hypothetical protein